MKLYCMFDVVAKEAGPVYEAKNDEVAKRNALQLLNKPNMTHPEDYHLYRVGTWDNEKMEITPEREYIPTNIDVTVN